MALFIFATMVVVVGLSIGVYAGKSEQGAKKYLYGGLLIIALYLAFIKYPNVKPLGIYSAITDVESESGEKSKVKVDISIEEYEDSYIEREDVLFDVIRGYHPETIYWANGAYTYLDPNATDWADEPGEEVIAVGYNDGEMYQIIIPEIEFRPVDKILAIGMMDLAAYAITFCMGIVAIIMLHSNKYASID
ncbi:MAG: hypothetical protein K6D96_04565 [Acetatifactor sp.]|nr:hypothetical protein [Acetatifactor sp.]